MTSHANNFPLTKDERQAMRDHIVWLSQQLETARAQAAMKTEFMRRLVDFEDLAHAVSEEIRQVAYAILIHDTHTEQESWNRK